MSPSIPPSIPCVVLTAVLLSLPPNRVCKGLTFSRTTTRLQETGRTATAATATASRPCPGIQTGQRATTTAKTSPILTLTLTHNNAAAGAVLYVVQQRLWSWVRASAHRSDVVLHDCLLHRMCTPCRCPPPPHPSKRSKKTNMRDPAGAVGRSALLRSKRWGEAERTHGLLGRAPVTPVHDGGSRGPRGSGGNPGVGRQRRGVVLGGSQLVLPRYASCQA